MNQASLSKALKQGRIGVMPTDTIYGIVGCALEKEVVERIYKVRKRNPQKPFIVLIGTLKDLESLEVSLTDTQKKALKRYWPGKVTIVLPLSKAGIKKFEYLHRGHKTLAVRFPKKTELLSLLKKTGPLIAPSANFEGMKPAQNLKEAKLYFGANADFYVSGKVSKKPSKIISLLSETPQIIRS